MTQRTAYGALPSQAPIDPVLALGIMMERAGNSREYQQAMAIAPSLSTGGLLDTSVTVDNSRLGVDLKANPNILTAISRNAGDEAYTDVATSLSDLSVTLQRYQMGRVVVTDRDRVNLDKGIGGDINAFVARQMSRRFAAQVAHAIYTAAFTPGAYASGFATTGGNIASAAYDLVSDLTAARSAMVGSGRWDDDIPLVATFADDFADWAVAKNDQVKDFATTTGSPGQPNDDLFARFVRHILGERVKVQICRYRYNNTSGTATRLVSMAWNIVAAGGDIDVSAFKFVNPGELMNLEEERSASVKGTVLYPDAYWQVLTAARPADAWGTAATDAGFIHSSYTTS